MTPITRIYLLASLALAAATVTATADDEEDKELAAWKVNIEATAQRLEESHSKMIEARIDELVRICKLGDEQLERFRLAAKGAVERTVQNYTLYQEKQWQRRKGGNLDPVPNLTEADQNPVAQGIWIDTITAELDPDQKKIYDEEMEMRAKYYMATFIRQTVQQLDFQFRYSAKQRAALTEHLEQSLPLPDLSGTINQNSTQIGFYKGLAKVPDEPLQEVLSKDQFDGWKEFKDRYVQAYQNR